MTDKSEKLATISLIQGNSVLYYLYITNTEKNKYFNLYKRCGMKRKPHYSGPSDKF